MGHAPGLYVSEDGRVECAEHAPYAGTDTWRFGHYIQITEGFEQVWLRDRIPAMQGWSDEDVRPRCETCNKTREEAESVAPDHQG